MQYIAADWHKILVVIIIYQFGVNDTNTIKCLNTGKSLNTAFIRISSVSLDCLAYFTDIPMTALVQQSSFLLSKTENKLYSILSYLIHLSNRQKQKQIAEKFVQAITFFTLTQFLVKLRSIHSTAMSNTSFFK